MELLWVLQGLGATHLVAVMSPGPSFLVVARTAVGTSRTAAAWTALGMGFGTIVWAVAALAGLKLLFASVPALYTLLKIAGAAYLIYLAIMLWRHASDPFDAGHGAATPLNQTRGGAIRRGFLTQMSNPKPAIFFGSIFITLVPPDAGPLFYALIVPLVFVNEAGWYLAVAMALSTRRLQAAYARAKPILDRGAGTLLAGLSARLVLDR